MDTVHMDANSLPEEIQAVADGIIDMLGPQRIYLYNHRVNHLGKTSGFKLCIIVQTDDKLLAEREIYLKIDSDVPFDVLLYTPGEWEELSKRDSSFACKISGTGTIIYG